MLQSPTVLLNNPVVRAAIQQAWFDSTPGIKGGHEEGGFIVQAPPGDLVVIRWPKGEQDLIFVPAHQNGLIRGYPILASFHTHPNTGTDYLQEPSETDKRAVRDDADLKGERYIGEFVISQAIIFLVTPVGRVREIADTQDIFVKE